MVLLTALVLLPTTWLRNLGMLAYISAEGFWLLFYWWLACAFEGIGFNEGDVLLNLRGMPTAISLYISVLLLWPCGFSHIVQFHDREKQILKGQNILKTWLKLVAI